MIKKLKIGLETFTLLPIAKQEMLLNGGYNPILWNDKPQKVPSGFRGKDYILFGMKIGESYSIVGLTGLMTLQQKCKLMKKISPMVFHVNTRAGIVIRIA